MSIILTERIHKVCMLTYTMCVFVQKWGECGDEARAAESSGVPEERTADPTEKAGGRSPPEGFPSGGRAAEETQEAGGGHTTTHNTDNDAIMKHNTKEL